MGGLHELPGEPLDAVAVPKAGEVHGGERAHLDPDGVLVDASRLRPPLRLPARVQRPALADEHEREHGFAQRRLVLLGRGGDERQDVARVPLREGPAAQDGVEDEDEALLVQVPVDGPQRRRLVPAPLVDEAVEIRDDLDRRLADRKKKRGKR